MMSRRSVVRDWSKEVEVNEERMEASGSTTSESRTRQGSENKKVEEEMTYTLDRRSNDQTRRRNNDTTGVGIA